MNNFSNKQEDQSILINQAEKKVLLLRDMIADLITDTGFKDIAKQIISPGYNLIDLIEDSHLGLTLLSGELPNHVAKYQKDLLEQNHLQEVHLRKEFSKMQQEFEEYVNCAQKDKTSLQIHIEKLCQDVSSYEYQMELLEKEKTSLKLKFEEELKDAEAVVLNLREEIITVKQETERKVCSVTKNIREAAESEEILQSKVNCLSEQSIMKEEEFKKIQFEKAAEIKSLKNNVMKLENDLMKEKSQIVQVEDVRREFVDNIRKLESSLEEGNKHKQSSIEEIQTLRNQSFKMKDNHATDMKDIQEKLNELNSTLCDKHSEIRLRDVKIMQLQNNLQLEEQKVLVINSESELLRKQIDRLQNRIENLIEDRPKGEQAVLLHTDGSYKPIMQQKQEISTEKIQLQMQRLLSQKDEEMKKLQDALSSEILKKNNELDSISKFVEGLEEQMVDVTSALSLSNGMAEASSRVASQLQSRNTNLVHLQESAARLHEDLHRISKAKVNVKSSASLSHMREDLDSFRIVAKKAREEASAARLELAKEKQKNSYLQIDLDSARNVIERKNRLDFLPSSKSIDDSKSDHHTSADSISSVLENSEASDIV